MEKGHFEKVERVIAILQRQASKVTKRALEAAEVEESLAEKEADAALSVLDGALKNMRAKHQELKLAGGGATLRAATRKAEAVVARARLSHTKTTQKWRERAHAATVAQKEHRRSQGDEARKRYMQEHWETLGDEQKLDAFLVKLGVADLQERREELLRQLEDIDDQLAGT